MERNIEEIENGLKETPDIWLYTQLSPVLEGGSRLERYETMKQKIRTTPRNRNFSFSDFVVFSWSVKGGDLMKETNNITTMLEVIE